VFSTAIRYINKHEFQFGMIDRDQVLQIVTKNGPTLPSKISKELRISMLFASASLAELTSKNALKASHIKVGSSPLYYAPGDEQKLQAFSTYLNEKDRRTYETLKEQKVMRDYAQEPLIRATLRSIKDFAVPLEVTFNNQKEIFWKWYLISNQEAEQIIKGILNVPSPEEVARKKKEDDDKARVIEEENIRKEKEALNLEDEKKRREEQARYEDRRKIEIEAENNRAAVEKKAFDAIEEERKSLEEEKKRMKKELLLHKQKYEEEIRKLKETYSVPSSAEQEKVQPQIIKKPEESDPFYHEVTAFFSQNHINLIDSKLIKKKSELEFTIELESVVGNLRYHCIAKNKKKISESDLNSAFVQSQLRKMPTLLLVKGDLTKKATEMLQKEFKGLAVKKI
jgi:hypothetical protein